MAQNPYGVAVGGLPQPQMQHRFRTYFGERRELSTNVERITVDLIDGTFAFIVRETYEGNVIHALRAFFENEPQLTLGYLNTMNEETTRITLKKLSLKSLEFTLDYTSTECVNYDCKFNEEDFLTPIVESKR